MKHIIPILIVLLLLSSGFVGVSNTSDVSIVDAETVERDELLDDLYFYCLDASGSTAKYEYYEEKLLQDYSNDDIEVEDIEQPVKTSPSIIQSGGPMDSPWPMKCHDTHHTSQSPYSTSNVTGLEKWRFDAGEWVDGGSILDEDGIIYVASIEKNLLAINPNGTKKWNYRTDDWTYSSPALDGKGTVYIGSNDNKLYCLNIFQQCF